MTAISSSEIEPHGASGKVVPGVGPVPAQVMLVGERPGVEEARRLKPFVGPAGQILDWILGTVGIDRERLYITNLVKTFLRTPPAAAEVARWSDVLIAEVASVQPEVIVPLGRHSSRFFLGNVDMEAVQGIPYRVDGRVILPVIHPAAGLHEPNMMVLTMSGFRVLRAVLQGRVRPVGATAIRKGGDYHCHRTAARLRIPRGTPVLSVDTEGVPERPWCLSYCASRPEAWVLRAGMAPGLDLIPYRVVFHNAQYDLPMLEAMGVSVGRFDDTLLMASLLKTEPIGLKPLARRHCRMEMQSYPDLMREPGQRLAASYLRKVASKRWPQPEMLVLRDGKYKVSRPWPADKRARKILDDPEADYRDRWENVDQAVRDEVAGLLGPMPEPTMDSLPRKTAIRYAARDAHATLALEPILRQRVEALGLMGAYRTDLAVVPMLARMSQVGMLVDRGRLAELRAEWATELERLADLIQDEAGYAINPASGDQLADLLFGKLALPSWRRTKSGSRPAVDDEALESLRGRHPAVDLVLDYKEVNKLLTTYVEPLPQWIRPDGRVHPNISQAVVPSGRLSTTKPNLLAQPVRTQRGRKLRQIFLAPEGRVLGTWDLDQIEMRVLAHESGDRNLIRVFQQGRDLHAWTAARISGRRAEADVSAEERQSAKNINFGIVYGISPYGLYAQTQKRGLDWSEDDCGKWLDEWFRLYPGVRTFTDETRAEAKRDGCVRDMVGRVFWTTGARSPIARIREHVLREAVNFKIQAGAQEVCKMWMARIWQRIRPMLGQVEPLLQIHDELLFELDPALRRRLGEGFLLDLQGAVRLRVPITAKYAFGRRWSDLEK